MSSSIRAQVAITGLQDYCNEPPTVEGWTAGCCRQLKPACKQNMCCDLYYLGVGNMTKLSYEGNQDFIPFFPKHLAGRVVKGSSEVEVEGTMDSRERPRSPLAPGSTGECSPGDRNHRLHRALRSVGTEKPEHAVLGSGEQGSDQCLNRREYRECFGCGHNPLRSLAGSDHGMQPHHRCLTIPYRAERVPSRTVYGRRYRSEAWQAWRRAAPRPAGDLCRAPHRAGPSVAA